MVDHFNNIDKETIGMLRNAHMKQVQLTVLADQKANMLMGIVLVTLSVIVSNIAMNDLDNEVARVAFAIFCITESIAVLMSLLVIVPRLGPKTQKGLLNDKHNPLFFMHFLNVDKEAFNEIMLEKMVEPKLVYQLILNDFYDMGFALKKKYIMLQRAYIIAAAGLIPASIIFISGFI